MICQFMLQDGNLMMGGRRVKTLVRECVEAPLNVWLAEQGNLGTNRHLVVSADTQKSHLLIDGKPVQ